MKTIGHIIMTTFLLAVMACKDNASTISGDAQLESDSETKKLETVYTDSIYQFTGVAVSYNDRLFVNYPYWLDQHQYSVVEVKQGKAVPYPDDASDLAMQELAQDSNLLIWPDSYSISKDGHLYITASQIQYMPWFHHGENKTKLPYRVLRLKL